MGSIYSCAKPKRKNYNTEQQQQTKSIAHNIITIANSEETVKLEGILKTTPKYQGLPKADPEAQRINSAEDPQFRQSAPIRATKQAQNINVCSNATEISSLSKSKTNEQKGGVPPIKRWRAKMLRRKARRLQRAMDTVEEANLLLDGMEANLAHLEAQ